MGMPGKSLKIVSRGVGTEIVQKQKRIEKRNFNESEGPPEMDPSPFDGWSAMENSTYFPDLAYGFTPLFFDGFKGTGS
jgi:hypothetical protein